MPSDAPTEPKAAGAATPYLIPIIALSGFASTFASRSVEPLVGVIARDLASDPQTIALLSATFTITYALCQPVLAPVGEGLGKERIIKVCLAVLGTALALSALVPDVGSLFVLRVAAGAAAGGCIPLSLAVIGDRIPVSGRQVALSRYLVAVILGQLLGSTLSGILAAWIGWRGVLLVSSALAFGAFAAIVTGLANTAAAGRVDIRAAIARYRAILQNPRALALFAFVFVEGVIYFGFLPYVAPLLEERGEGGPFEAGVVIAGFAVGGLVYSAMVAWLLRTLGLAAMLRVGGVLGAGALLGLAAAGSWLQDAVAMISLGLGFYMLHNSFQAQVTEVAPEARATAVSLHAFSYFAGQAIGVVMLGLGLRTIGMPAALVLCAMVSVGLGLVAAAILTGRSAWR